MEDGTEIIKKAYEKRSEDRNFQLYVSAYQNMDKDSFLTFEDFFKPKIQEDLKTESEILLEVKEVIDTFRKEGE